MSPCANVRRDERSRGRERGDVEQEYYRATGQHRRRAPLSAIKAHAGRGVLLATAHRWKAILLIGVISGLIGVLCCWMADTMVVPHMGAVVGPLTALAEAFFFGWINFADHEGRDYLLRRKGP